VTFRMKKTATLSISLLAVLCWVQAHRPIFSEKAATSPETAVLIAQPWVSQVIYREVTATSSQVWLAFDINEGFELFLQIGVPVLGRLKDFRPAMEFAAHDVAAVGISPDTPASQKKFDGKYHLGFPQLSDPDRKVAQAYGAWGKKSMYGKTYEGIIRSSFLVDEKGKIVQVSYKVKPEDTVPNAKQALNVG